MTFRKFLIFEGEITSRYEVDIGELDDSLLHEAIKILTQLRESPEDAVQPIPGIPNHFIGLGSDTIEYIRSFMTGEFPADYPAEELASILDHSDKTIRHLQSFSLVVKWNGFPYSVDEYSVLPMPMEDELKDILEGKIVASTLIPKERHHEKPYRDRWEVSRILMEEIWVARPCLVCFGKDNLLWSSFIDYMVAAMLLNP